MTDLQLIETELTKCCLLEDAICAGEDGVRGSSSRRVSPALRELDLGSPRSPQERLNHHHRIPGHPPPSTRIPSLEMSNQSSPLPDLPLEVHGHILRFCDPSTLAVTSRVSLAFLDFSGPLLYRDIVITGRDQLEMLIRSEVSTAIRLLLNHLLT
jgi:hypothetical protein